MSRTGCDGLESKPAGFCPETVRVTPPADATPPDAPLRILVAEDSEFNSQLMEKLLAKRGHAVRLVASGREALALANAADFDLLLLDVHLPEMDGFEVIKRIRQSENAAGAAS